MLSSRRLLAGRARYAALVLALCVAMPTLLIVSSSAANNPKGALEQWVPAGTYAFVSVPNLKAARDAFHKTALWKIWEDEEVKQALEPTRQAIDKQWDDFQKSFEEKLGLKFDDAVEVLDGQVALAVVDLPGAKDHGPEKFDFVYALDTGSYRDRAEQLIAKGKEEILKDNPNLKEGSYDFKGLKVGSLGDEQITVHYAFVGSTLLVGTQKATFEGVLTAANDGLQTCLANDPEFAKVRATVGGGGENFLAWVNVAGLYGKYEPEMEEDAVRVIDGLGLRGVKSAAVAVALGEDDVKDMVYIHAPGPRKGLPRMLSLASAAPMDLSIVPKDAIAVAVMNIDLAQLYGDILDTVRKVADKNDVKEMDDGIAKAEEEVGFKFDDLLSSIGTQFVSFSAFPEAGGIFPDSVTAVELRDPAKFDACLTALTAKKKAEFRTLPFQGETIHYLAHVEPPEGVDREAKTVLSGLPMAYVIRGKTLYFSANTQALRRMILSVAKGGQTIKDNPMWQQANARLSGAQGLLAYYDFARLFDIGYNTVVPIGTYFQGFLSEAGIPLDLARMPLGETLGKYISQSITGVASDAEGIKIESHSSIGLSITGVMAASMVAAVAIPSMQRARGGAGERMAALRLKQLVQAQAQWKIADPEGTGVCGYEVASVWEMYGHKDKDGKPVQYIEQALAQADFGKLGAQAVPAGGYFFAVIEKDESGAPYTQKASEKFAFCAWPAQYGATGTRSFIVNEAGVIYARDQQGMGRLEQWPGEDPSTLGWIPFQ